MAGLPRGGIVADVGPLGQDHVAMTQTVPQDWSPDSGARLAMRF